MVTAMRLIGIQPLRKLALLVFIPAIALTGLGCSSFNREWKKVAPNPDASGLEGHWEGRWMSDVNHHHGRLRCIVSKDGDDYRARFHAKYLKILGFGYTIPLKAEAADSGYKFHGEADLGSFAGGIYHYEGHADARNFLSTYSSKYDHGTFQMERR
jgi:hypothetical protein